ncbi:class II aldolase/adducin family protein, partial [Alphaproteobacteria bacterium]|nr:class II aldolase/adducin family protein [Alphaproteobacteria bacterium]
NDFNIYERARTNNFTISEWKARVDLAACHQIFYQKGWTDGINTHLSVRIPDKKNKFLLKPDYLMFHEVKASNLVELDYSGNYEGSYPVNLAGAIIHGAILQGRDDINCVLHHHTDAAIAVSSLKEGLLPMSQHALAFYGNIGYHDYEGVALDESEKESLKRDLGKYNTMLLRNHGVISCGKTIAGAYAACDALEVACRSQLLAQNTGLDLQLPSEKVKNFTAKQFQGFGENRANDLEWPALLRWLDYLEIKYAE